MHSPARRFGTCMDCIGHAAAFRALPVFSRRARGELPLPQIAKTTHKPPANQPQTIRNLHVAAERQGDHLRHAEALEDFTAIRPLPETAAAEPRNPESRRAGL